ncbi:MAG TPA: hypothetical protein VH394_20920 [Thermoanaerobaculia bacterium]|jgi:hypothetical protein|nr:hypothetical protein [Thermoanaerobaculia bacterium]
MNEYIDPAEIVSPSEATALLKLELIGDSHLPAIAENLLIKGFDTKSLRRLAVEVPPSSVNLFRLFEEANVALRGDQFSTKQDAASWLVLDIASRIVEGSLEPYRGAKIIWIISLVEGVAVRQEAGPFIYAASEYEERPEDRQFFVDAIVMQARRILES